MSFQCTVVTPEAEAFNATITQAILPAHDGLLGILTDRSPLLVKLGTGPLRVDTAPGQSSYFFVDGGIAQMKDNKLTILTPTATPASELDAETARAEYAQALASVPTDKRTAEDRQRQLKRAQAKQQTLATAR
jgi:F-type H+-transporting ATPase subunit epsilon